MFFKIKFLLILLNVCLIQSDNKPFDDNSDDMTEVSVRRPNEKDRKYHQTKEELALIKLEPRFEGEPCSGQSFSIFILSAARTSGGSYLKRQAERNTWVKEAKQRQISSYFVIALSKNETTNQLLKEESKQYKDMIQMQFIDSYWNLTLKTLSILNWSQKRCQKSKIIVKTDDDTVVNINLLLDSLDQFKPGITGYKDDNKITVPRDNSSMAWYPKEYFKPDNYPEYIYGGFYAITSDVIPKLLETLDTYNDTVLDLEDLFVTGVLAEKAGVPRYSTPLITGLQGCPLNLTANMSSLLVLADCASGEELTQFYETWKKTTDSPNTGSFKNHCSFVAHFICLLIIIEFYN